MSICISKFARARLAEFLVQGDEPKFERPSTDDRTNRKTRFCPQGYIVSRAIVFGIKIWRVDVGCIGNHVDNTERDGLLLHSLSHSCGDPTQNARIDAVYANSEKETCNIAGSMIECAGCDNKTGGGYAHSSGYMPRAFVVPTRAHSVERSDYCSHDEGWSRQNKCDRSVESHRAYNRGKEVGEGIG